MEIRVSLNNESIWYSDSYYLNGRNHINITEKDLPYNYNYLEYCNNYPESKLVIKKITIDKENSEFLQHPIIVKKEESTNECIKYNINTKQLEKSSYFDNYIDMVFSENPKLVLIDDGDEYKKIIKFCIDVLRQNDYVYSMITTLICNKNGKYINKRLTAEEISLKNFTKNLYNNLNNINSFEKTSKVMGFNFIYQNIVKDNFQLNDAKKLTQVMEIPKKGMDLIKKLNLFNSYDELKQISQKNENYLIILLNSIYDLKRITKFHKDNFTFNTFFLNLNKLLDSGHYNDFKALLNYLYREEFYFNRNKFTVPYEESSILLDYVNLIEIMLQNNPNMKFDFLPKNLRRAHQIISKNNSILTNPRPTEFNNAVTKYKDFVNWIPDDKYEYFFKAPETEIELLDEGNILHHCVASYRDMIIDGCIVVFLRKKDDPNTPFVTIEYKDGKVLQVKEIYNNDVTDKDILNLVTIWLSVTRKKELKRKGC